MVITAILKVAASDSFIITGDIIFIFPIRSTFGVATFGATKPFIVTLFVPVLDGTGRNIIYGTAYDSSTYE